MVLDLVASIFLDKAFNSGIIVDLYVQDLVIAHFYVFGKFIYVSLLFGRPSNKNYLARVYVHNTTV